jgi:RNA polymerase sigma factor (TIGR02999 family)
MQGAFNTSKQTVDELMPSVYDELRRLAHRYLLGERPGHTLRPTALVNEVYLKLARQRTEWQDKSKFVAVAARAMRHILVDHARSQSRKKRGLRPQRVTLTETVAIAEVSWPDLLDLDEALDRLGELDRRKAQAIELLFFGGLTYDECAEALAISPVTLYRELKMAKAWLNRELAPTEGQK